MYGFYRWICNHRTLAKMLYFVLVAFGLWYVQSALNAGFFVLTFIALLLIFVVFVTIDNCYVPLLKESKQLLDNNCDPYPYLLQTELLSTYKLTDVAHQMVTLDHCAMLLEIGKAQEAYDRMISINIDKNAGILPVCKSIYYNNLSCSCLILNKTEEARIWFEKAQLIAQDIRDEKQRKSLQWSHNCSHADLLYHEGKYEEALAILKQNSANSLHQQVSQAMLFGRIYFAMEHIEKASVYLNYVCINGNRMYEVTEAKSLLEKLKNSEISC